MAKNPKSKFSASEKRKLEREIGKQATKAIRPVISDLQKMLNDMSSEFAGQPVEEIKPVLAARFKRVAPDGSLKDPELTRYAKQIAAGDTFKLKP